MGRVEGKTSIVTGGAHGIGKATAQRLAEEFPSREGDVEEGRNSSTRFPPSATWENQRTSPMGSSF